MERVWVVGGLALIAVTTTMACSRGEATEENAGPEYATVQKRDMDIRAEASGTIEPILVVEVKSKASGEVLKLHVETGDEVKKGTLLAEIDPRDVRNGYEQAKADLAVAQARLETSQAQHERTVQLRKENVVTEQELETAALDVANNEAQLIKARTNLQLAEERLADVTITAPLDGTIITKTVEEGQIIASASQTVSGGTPLLTMADLSEMQVRALVDETDLGRIKPGLPATVTVEAYPDRTFRGRVLKIEPQAVVDQNVTMFPVIIRLDNAERLLKPGMNAEIVFEIAQRTDVVVVPNSAIVNPQEAGAAGEILGLNADQVREALARPARQTTDSTVARPVAAVEGGPGAADGGREDCMALMQKIRAAGGFQNMSTEDRTKMRACREQFGRQGGGSGEAGGGQNRASNSRPAVVFVSTAQGIEPRRVTLGLNDWDYSEVLNGVEPGEKVVIMSVARIQAQQEQMTNRIRERASGPISRTDDNNSSSSSGRGR